MNLQKIVKILPMLDSPVDAEALTALRILQRALLPETCGDIARLIEAQGFGPELEAEAKKPFNGFGKPKERVKPTKPPIGDWIWNEASWSWKERVKPPRPLGEGWFWHERTWTWNQKPKPMGTRFETYTWIDPDWVTKIDFPAVMNAAMEVMNQKLGRNDKKVVEAIFVSAMAEKPIPTSELRRLENIENMVSAQTTTQQRYNTRYGNV